MAIARIFSRGRAVARAGRGENASKREEGREGARGSVIIVPFEINETTLPRLNPS